MLCASSGNASENVRPTGGCSASSSARQLAWVIWPSGDSTTTASVACSRTERAKRSAAAICSARRWIERSVSRTSVAVVSPIEIGRDQTATGMASSPLRNRLASRRGLGNERRRLAFEQRSEIAADQTRARIAGQFAEPVVDIEDDAVRTGGQRAVAHALDQHAIGLLGALQQNDLRTFEGPHHHDGVDVALVDGLQRSRRHRRTAAARDRLSDMVAPAQFGRMSRPTSTFSVLDRSPMMRLSGSGNWRISVGMATI